MRWPLRYQILFPFAGVMLAVVVGVSLLDAYLAARRTQHRIEDQLRSAVNILIEANFPLTDAVLRQTSGLSGAHFLLADADGRMQATSLPNAEVPSGGNVTAANEFALGHPIELAGQRYLQTVIAMDPRGSTSSPKRLHVLYPEHILREARWEAAYPPLAVGSVLLCVVIALAILIAGRLSRPILELRRQLSRLVQGEFQAVPLPERNDELRDLISSVNTLGDQLEELRAVIKRSERLSLLGQLSGGLAHQLRNSVTGARLAVQLHQRHCSRIDQDSLAVALRQLSMTEAHLQRFLSAGRPAAPQRACCDLKQIAADVASLVEPACKHRGVRVETTIGDAGSNHADAPIELWADADQIRQLLLNLVLNGLEAAGVNGWVRVELEAADTTCRARVLDSGPGPANHVSDRLFEAFATGKPEGIGLGLAVAKTIADGHFGTIRHTGARPTCFEVVLPRGIRPDNHVEPRQIVHAG
jgi:signal transduction histidine kinase